jgi:hypothetical protein
MGSEARLEILERFGRDEGGEREVVDGSRTETTTQGWL